MTTGTRQREEAPLRALAEQLDTADQDRAPRRAEPLHRVIDRLGELAPIRAGPGKRAVPIEDLRGHRDRDLHRVPVDLEIAGAVLSHDLSHHLVDLPCRQLRLAENPRRAGHLGEDSALALHVLHLVVDAGDLLLGLPGAAGDDQQRNLLGVGARDGIDDVVPPRSIGDAHDAEAARASRVAVGREAHRRLVREGDDLEAAILAEAVEEREHQVPGKAEDVIHSCAVQIGDQEVAECHPGLHRRASGQPPASVIELRCRVRTSRAPPPPGRGRSYPGAAGPGSPPRVPARRWSPRAGCS